MSDRMRVELSLPIHMMLSVLLCGANCADPGARPSDAADFDKWKQRWINHKEKLKADAEFRRSYETFLKTKKLLMEAAVEAIEDLPEKKKVSLWKRVERVHIDLVKPYTQDHKTDPRKIGIITYYLLQHLIEHNVLIIPEDSAFGEALQYMLPALSPPEDHDEEDADYEALHRSARKQVPKIVERLQAEGYYHGIPLPTFH